MARVTPAPRPPVPPVTTTVLRVPSTGPPEPETTTGPAASCASGPVTHITPGSDLLSRGPSPGAPSALRGLTTLFGMGRGVSPSLLPPRNHEGRTLKTA